MKRYVRWTLSLVVTSAVWPSVVSGDAVDDAVPVFETIVDRDVLGHPEISDATMDSLRRLVYHNYPMLRDSTIWRHLMTSAEQYAANGFSVAEITRRLRLIPAFVDSTATDLVSSTSQVVSQDADPRVQVIPFTEGEILLRLPSNEWAFDRVIEQPGVNMFQFFHEAMQDSHGHEIRPGLVVAIERHLSAMDAVEYSAVLRSRARVPWEIDSILTHENSPIQLRNALWYKIRYPGKHDHVAYIIHAREGTSGLQVILDVISELGPALRDDWDDIVESLRVIRLPASVLQDAD